MVSLVQLVVQDISLVVAAEVAALAVTLVDQYLK
tara:strand:- start:230 stop:331 length:102 start_codon:yes stop_codon:yes gene_type:complete